MIIEHEGKIYETVITKPIKKGDYFYDFMINEVRICNSFICYDPWVLKMKIVEKPKKLTK
jgi:hypothetical protein